MSDNIVAVDTSHLLYRLFHQQIGDRSRLSRREAQVVIDNAISQLREYKKGSDVFITAFDDKHSWRTAYSTKNNLRQYKSNRYKVKSLKDRLRQDSFNQLRDAVESKLRRMGGVTVLKGNMLEADDLLGGLAMYKRPSDKLTIHTLDKDFASLVGPNIGVINMMDGSNMEYKSINERVLRGRPSYSVNSVFNRLPSDKYLQLENGSITMDDLFEELNSNPVSAMKAKTRYKHNRVLLDVTQQPKSIKRQIKSAIKSAF